MTTNLPLYPCDRGGGSRGNHHFQAGPTGIICCTYCGAAPASSGSDT